MLINMFQSDEGDCVLLESAGGIRILCDGGMVKSMKAHVRSHLSELDHLDVIYVSHIDEDHISGVLQLLEDAVRWAVHQKHINNGDGGVTTPTRPEPPTIGGIWHNSFRAQTSKNRGAIEGLLAHVTPVLLGSQVGEMATLGGEYKQIGTSIKQALKVSRLIRADVLDIPLNKIPGQSKPAKLMMRRPNQKPFQLGDLKVTIVGPSKKALSDLRKGWDDWLRRNRGIRRDIERYVVNRLNDFTNGTDFDPFDLGDWNGVASFRGVTAPNVASLVLMIEEGDTKILITGDAQQDVLLSDLKETGFLKDGHLHVDVLKVQHHGSEHNTDEDFCKIVSADNYLFCGNGANTNPELSVIKMYYSARLGPEKLRAKSPDAKDEPFAMWFSTSFRNQHGNNRTHMKKVEKLVDNLVKDSGGLMDAHFNEDDALEMEFV